MPITIIHGKDEVQQTQEEKDREQADSKAYIQRNKRRGVFLTPPEQLKDLLLGIRVYHTVQPGVFDEDQTPRTTKVGAGTFVDCEPDDPPRGHLAHPRAPRHELHARSQSQADAPSSSHHRQYQQHQHQQQNAQSAAPDAQPTLLQRIRLIHNTNGKFKSALQKEDLLTLIDESQQRVMSVRSGGASAIDTEPRDIRETISWAIGHVDQCADPLGALFTMEEQVLAFQAERRRVAERYRAHYRRDPEGEDQLANFFIEHFLVGSPHKMKHSSSSSSSSTRVAISTRKSHGAHLGAVIDEGEEDGSSGAEDEGGDNRGGGGATRVPARGTRIPGRLKAPLCPHPGAQKTLPAAFAPPSPLPCRPRVTFPRNARNPPPTHTS